MNVVCEQSTVCFISLTDHTEPPVGGQQSSLESMRYREDFPHPPTPTAPLESVQAGLGAKQACSSYGLTVATLAG